MTITKHRVSVARTAMQQAMGDMPSSDGGGGKGSHSDRTGNLAFRQHINPDDPKRGHHADVARRDWDDLDQLLLRILYRSARNLPVTVDEGKVEVILKRWAPLTAESRAGLQSKGDESGSGWCQSHWARGATRPPRSPGSRLCQFCEGWLKTLNDPDGEWRLDLEVLPQRMIDRNMQGKHVDSRDLPPKGRPHPPVPTPHSPRVLPTPTPHPPSPPPAELESAS